MNLTSLETTYQTMSTYELETTLNRIERDIDLYIEKGNGDKIFPMVSLQVNIEIELQQRYRKQHSERVINEFKRYKTSLLELFIKDMDQYLRVYQDNIEFHPDSLFERAKEFQLACEELKTRSDRTVDVNEYCFKHIHHDILCKCKQCHHV
jgi:hypothetical protein